MADNAASNGTQNGKQPDNANQPGEEITAMLDDSVHKANRTRKNAIKQMRTTATKLKNSTADSPQPVREHAEQIAQNLYEIADFLDTLAVDQTTPILPEPSRSQVIMPPVSKPESAAKTSPQTMPEDDLVVAFTPQQLLTGAAFVVGMFVGMFLRRK